MRQEQPHSAPRIGAAIRNLPVAVHATVIAVLLVAFATMRVIQPNMGGVWSGFILMIFGLPWSVPTFINPVPLDSWVSYLLFLAPAVLNVVLHILVRYLALRRAHR